MIEELHRDYQDKIGELKERYDVEKNALEIQNKKLKQDEDLIMRRRSDILLKPLLNELNGIYDEKSALFETFKNTSLEYENVVPSDKDLVNSNDDEDEGEALKKEIERRKKDSHQNLLKTQESVKLTRRNTLLELEGLMNVYKNDMIAFKEEIVVLKAKLEEKSLENERKAVVITENVKKLQEVEARNTEIEEQMKSVKDNCVEAGKNLQKIERFIGATQDMEGSMKDSVMDGINICRTRFIDLESNVTDVAIKQFEVQDLITQIKYQCNSVPQTAEAIKNEILTLRTENEKLKSLNALHETEKDNLIKELFEEEKTLSDLKETLGLLSKNYAEAFADQMIQNSE